MTENVASIVVRALAKHFSSHSGTVHALKGVDFEVRRGTVFCILGPNGAGKTTLLRILTTLMRPSAGTAWIENLEVGRQNIQIRPLIGIVAQDNHFDRYLNVWQNLCLHADMHGLPRASAQKRIAELLERVGLYERREDSVEDFSGGMQRRVALIRALIHEPRVLFLDEPTTGLDPAVRRDIWQIIQALKGDTTVILTTHYMEEADRLSDRILILSQGTVVMEGTPDELKRRIVPPDTYELLLSGALAETYRHRLAEYIHEAHIPDPNLLRFRLNRPADWTALMAAIQPEDLQSIGLAQTDLETVYLRVTGLDATAAKASEAEDRAGNSPQGGNGA
jgi:ABC-2 type transport system ATP-binding protein